jgi:hypothetical protein
MQLIYLRDEIEAGKTAKLVIPPNREGGVEVTVRIKKQGEYFWQRAHLSHPRVLSESTNTAGFATWEQLLDSISGMQTLSIDWTLCDDELEDFLPTRAFHYVE